jgi:ATP-binding cassette ChvD family protein
MAQAAPKFVFEMENMTKAYGDNVVLENINLSFYHGAKIGIVGDNGTGKSTLLRIMAGVDKDISGRAEPCKGIRVGYVPQEPQLDTSKSIKENLLDAFTEVTAWVDRYNQISVEMCEEMSDEAMNKLMEEMGTLQEKIDAVDGWELDRQLEIAADAMVLPPDDANIATLSGGEARRVALCKAFLEKPDILLLDEPTNHLDGETIDWMEQFLREYEGTVIVVTHDRYFLDNITKWILEIENTRGIPFEGNYSQWLARKIQIMAEKEKTASSRRKMLNNEIKWLKMNNEERQRESRARISNFEEMIRKGSEGRMNASEIMIAPGPELGEKVLTFNNITKGFDDITLIDGLSFDIPRGAVVGILGPNGVGKSTMFKMINGSETPDSGTVEVGPTVAMSYVDQQRDHLDGSKTIFEEITGGADEISLGKVMIPSRAYVSRFAFTGKGQQKLVGNLSGGERNRVHLAKLLRQSGNFLLLDEPTNDLDVGTLQTLENAILQYQGSIMLISHDRFFLDRVCTHMIVFEGNAKVRWFEGNFEAYEERRREELKDNPQKRRGAFKRLSR